MSKAKTIATRGVAWRVDGGGEVNRERGEEISDAPASVLAELTSTKGDDGVPYAVTLVEWQRMQSDAGGGDHGED